MVSIRSPVIFVCYIEGFSDLHCYLHVIRRAPQGVRAFVYFVVFIVVHCLGLGTADNSVFDSIGISGNSNANCIQFDFSA